MDETSLFDLDDAPGKTTRKVAKKKSATRRSRGSDDPAAKARDISVAEFFEKNRHMLGFDSPSKAILMAVKEAVDNSLDACEEANILPSILVELNQVAEKVYRVAIEDNGPGIADTQIGKIFGKLLYGSKFHKLSQSRGQQGIGISAAGMYGKLTTGKPVLVRSKRSRGKAVEFTLSIDSARNKPEVHSSEVVDWGNKKHGTRVEIEMEATYNKGVRSVDMYLKQTAIANPHLTLCFVDPSGDEVLYEANSKVKPEQTVEIKPHPHGIELGRLIGMLKDTSCRSLSGFLQEEFCRVGPTVAKKIIKATGKSLTEKSYPTRIAREEASALYKAINETKISSPPTDCIAPIGDELLLKGLKKEIDADFYATSTRPAAVYRGNPFQVEVGIAYGKPGGVGLAVEEDGRIRKMSKAERAVVELLPEKEGEKDEPKARILRFANRVPLLYQQSGCAITKSITQTNWRSYGLSQPGGNLPIGQLLILVHIASVWVPFTSESKEAIASYDEIIKEVKLGLQVCGRKLGAHIRKGKRLKREYDKREYIEKYMPHISIALQEILGLSEKQTDETTETLGDVLHKSRKF